MYSDLLLFVETFTTNNAIFDFVDFHQFVKLDNDDATQQSNAGKGMGCYIKSKNQPFLNVLDYGCILWVIIEINILCIVCSDYKCFDSRNIQIQRVPIWN